ncbi:hypothetical protein TNCV_3325831 [Trichonephila clavipes]|nr:hypothetical protein TNCV_3325831 [Trichonephila clavipes]
MGISISIFFTGKLLEKLLFFSEWKCEIAENARSPISGGSSSGQTTLREEERIDASPDKWWRPHKPVLPPSKIMCWVPLMLLYRPGPFPTNGLVVIFTRGFR